MENGKYKYEIHCHTDETSNCGRVPAAELVELYKSKGYDGVVITDHYSRMTYKRKLQFLHPDNEHFLEGYRNAKAAAGENFTVLLGMEKRAFASPIDYLVYGMTEEFVLSHGNLVFRYIHLFRHWAKKAGFIIVGAHPYRMFPSMPILHCIDGVEVYNGKESRENNQKALKWAEKHGKTIMTSGSDFHRTTHTNFSGILTEEPIRTNDDLLRILKSGKFERIENAENSSETNL